MLQTCEWIQPMSLKTEKVVLTFMLIGNQFDFASVITNAFYFVALSCYYDACVFKIIFLKYEFLIVHKIKHSSCQFGNNAITKR